MKQRASFLFPDGRPINTGASPNYSYYKLFEIPLLTLIWINCPVTEYFCVQTLTEKWELVSSSPKNGGVKY